MTEIDETQRAAIIDAAHAEMRKHMRGARGQMITEWDSVESWVVQTTEQHIAAERDRLRHELEASEALVADLREKLDEAGRASIALRDDMLERARLKMDVIHGEKYRVVNAGNSAWRSFSEMVANMEGRKDG